MFTILRVSVLICLLTQSVNVALYDVYPLCRSPHCIRDVFRIKYSASLLDASMTTSNTLCITIIDADNANFTNKVNIVFDNVSKVGVTKYVGIHEKL